MSDMESPSTSAPLPQAAMAIESSTSPLSALATKHDPFTEARMLNIEGDALAPPTAGQLNVLPNASTIDPSMAIPSDEANAPLEAGPMDPTLALTEFTLFPKFPPELRLKVWKLALPGPRIMEIEWCDRNWEWFCPVESQNRPSGMVRANRESRDVFLKSYIALFKLISVNTKYTAPGCSHNIFPNATAYFDPTIDLLYIGPSTSGHLCIRDDSVSSLMSMPWIRRVTGIACEFVECFDAEKRNEIVNLPIGWCPPNIEEFVIVVDDMNHRKWTWRNRPRGELEFIEPLEEFPQQYGIDVKDCSQAWISKLNRKEIPTLIFKKALRGGIVPKVAIRTKIVQFSDRL